MNVLTDKDILEILKSNNISINGIFQKDKLHNIKPGFYIINLQSSKDGNGTHWTSLYYNPELSLYFDSYGFCCPEDIELLINDYKYNTIDIQSLESSSCGYYCIAFIKFLYNKKNKEQSFETFTNIFNKDTNKNELILNELLNI